MKVIFYAYYILHIFNPKKANLRRRAIPIGRNVIHQLVQAL